MNLQAKIVYGSWRWGGNSATLVFKSNQQFVAVNGEIIEAGEYRRVPCAVTGRDITIPFIADIPATTNSTTDVNATWDTWFEDSGGTRRLDWLIGFRLSHVFSNPVAWEDVYMNNNPPSPSPAPPGITFDQAVLLLNGLAAQIAGNTLATGIGILAAAQATTILDARVTADSPIKAIPRDDGISGNLRIFNRVAGVSFDVISDNGADEGNFTWILYP